jgi:hypothetical protein
VQLVEIPTADETNDNIVAFWTPVAIAARGTPVADYRIHWTMDEPAILNNEVGWVKQTFHTDGELTQANLIRAFDGTTALLVDFTGGPLGKLPAGTGAAAGERVQQWRADRCATAAQSGHQRLAPDAAGEDPQRGTGGGIAGRAHRQRQAADRDLELSAAAALGRAADLLIPRHRKSKLFISIKMGCK